MEYAEAVARTRFNAISKKTLDMIEDYITSGFKETLVNLLIYLGDDRCKTALIKLPEPLRSELELLLHAEQKKRTMPEVIVDAAYIFKRKGWYGKTMADDVLENLSGLEISALNFYQDDFFEINPILTMNVERYALTFDDLIHLDDRSIQKLLREVTQETLAIALKKADEKVKEKIFRNMSVRAANMVKEDMEFVGQVRLEDIEEAQCKIIKLAKKLENEGQIFIDIEHDD